MNQIQDSEAPEGHGEDMVTRAGEIQAQLRGVLPEVGHQSREEAGDSIPTLQSPAGLTLAEPS